MQRVRDSEIPRVLLRMPRFRDWADIFRDASFSIDHSIPLYFNEGKYFSEFEYGEKSSGYLLNFSNKGHQHVSVLSTYTMDTRELPHFLSNTIVPLSQRICKTIQFRTNHSVYNSKITVR